MAGDAIHIPEGTDLGAMLLKLDRPNLAYLDWQSRWLATARPDQIPPEDGWDELGYMAGRGYGKSRTGAEWLGRVSWECTNELPRCVVAPTQNDVRFTCFEGQSGLCSVIPPECVKVYSSSDLVLELNNGVTIRGFSAEKADRLRGPEHADAWLEELGAWGKDAEYTFDMMQMGLRIGPHPRFLWTTTPRPTALMRRLTTPKAGRVIVRGSTFDNKANLSKTFIDNLAIYEGTKIGRQELYGELIDPEESGIIRRSQFRLWPVGKPLPKFEIIIMSLDTAFTEKTLDSKGDPDPTACSVWGVFKDAKRTQVLLLDCWEEHLGLPDLMRKVKREMQYAYGDDEDEALIKPLIGRAKPASSGHKPDILLIEDKGSGISLRQMLAESGIEAYPYNPGRADKLTRLHIVSPIFFQKRIWVPESSKLPGQPTTWATALISQLCSFVGEGSIKHDDFVDSTTQAMRLLMDKGMISLLKEQPSDATERPPPEVRQNPYGQ